MERITKIEMRILRRRELMVRLGVSRTTLWRMAKDAKFPKPIEVSTGVTGWVEHEVDRWVEDRMRQRVELPRPNLPGPPPIELDSLSTTRRRR